MPTLSIWTNAANKVHVVQLSDDPYDGTDAQQLAHLKTLSAYSSITCVSENYQGTFPSTDSAYWIWNNGQVGTTTPASKLRPLSPAQVRLVLNQYGLLAQVEATIAAGSRDLQIEWGFRTEFNRDNVLLNSMATSLGLSAGQLDNMFKAGVLL